MDRDALELLAVTSIRRLWDKRNSERHGIEARKAIRQWSRTLRTLA